MEKYFLQLLINGIIGGATYALVAAGFSLIYSTNKFAHFAHAGVITSSAYFLFWIFSKSGSNIYFLVTLTILFSSFLGHIINRFFYRPFRTKKSSSSILLVVSVAVLIILESSVLLFFGADVKMVGLIKNSQGIEFFGAIITPLQIVIILVSTILFFILFVLTRKTKIGKAMRAVADNKDLTEIIGISSEKIYSWSFIIGSAIAGCAAILISLEQNITPMMGTSLMIKGFVGAIIGGITSVPGAILGSLLLGMAENFSIWFMPSGYKDAAALIFLFIFLIFKPQGILGIKNN